MNHPWRITVWGVRGSAPRPSPDCMEYGGNTSCSSLEYHDRILVLDAGTGLASLGTALSSRQDVKRLDVLISHYHLDHIQGLVSFHPLFDPNMEIHFYGGAGLEKTLETLIGSPFWPVGVREFPAKLRFHTIRPGECFSLEGIEVSTLAGNHPGGSTLYRLDGEGKRLTCALDCETDPLIFRALTDFAQGSDLLIWDANFIPADLRSGWGHSTWAQGLELARAAGVKQILMTHHNWDYTDSFLRGQEKIAGQNEICRFAKEGMVITI